MTTGAKVAAGFKRDQVVDRTENRGRDNPSASNAGFGAGIMNQGGINLGMNNNGTSEMTSTQFSAGYQPSAMS